MKLKTLLEDKVSDTIKEMYPHESQMIVTRIPVTGDKHVPSYKESTYTIRLNSIGKPSKGFGIGYIVELKRAVQVLWRGKTPTHLISKKAKWEVVAVRLVK
jgi:hypothetical protein